MTPHAIKGLYIVPSLSSAIAAERASESQLLKRVRVYYEPSMGWAVQVASE